VRIIAGSRKGRRLVDWEESGIRPMRDFVRTAMFNILSDFVSDARFLDLFCGTGSVGLEALSRGARSCTFVDRSPVACGIVRRNLDALDLLAEGEVIEGEILDVIEGLARRGREYELVFIGPPYGLGLAPIALSALAAGDLLTADPVVVAEVRRGEDLNERFGVLERVDDRLYGDNRIVFHRRSGMV